MQVSCSPFLQNLVCCCVIFMAETYCNATLVLELDDNKYRRYPKQQTNLKLSVVTIIIKTTSRPPVKFSTDLKFCQTALIYIWQSKKLQFPLNFCGTYELQGAMFSPEVNKFSRFHEDSASGLSKHLEKPQKVT